MASPDNSGANNVEKKPNCHYGEDASKITD